MGCNPICRAAGFVAFRLGKTGGLNGGESHRQPAAGPHLAADTGQIGLVLFELFAEEHH